MMMDGGIMDRMMRRGCAPADPIAEHFDLQTIEAVVYRIHCGLCSGQK